MSQQNPYLAPQTISQPAGGVASAVSPWQEPLRSQILDVATHQRWLNIHLLIAITGAVLFGLYGQRPNPQQGQAPLTIVGLLVMIVLIPNYIAILVRIYLMVRGFKSKDSPVAAVLAMFVPLIGLLLLLYYSSKATKFLDQYGIKVGLLGASPSAVTKQLDSAALAANPAAKPAAIPPSTMPQRSVPQISVPQISIPGAAPALPVAQAIPAAPARPAPPLAAAAKPGVLPQGKPLAAKPAAPPPRPAATGQLPVAKPLPPVQPKPPLPPKQA